jgi:hypothetical protein
MILFPTFFVFEDLLGLNFYPLLSETTGVSERTWKNQIKGRHIFKPGTFNKIYENTNLLAKKNNPEYARDVRELFDEIFKSESVLGWGQLLDGFNYATQPDVLLPHTQKIIREFEACSIRFVKIYKADGHKKAVRYLLSLKLPSGFISEEDISFIKGTKSIEPLSKFLVLESMKSLLYFASSIDAEMIKPSESDPSCESKLAKFLPVEADRSVLLPIPRFLHWSQSSLGFTKQSEIINFIDNEIAQIDENAKSVRRQWIRWQNGELVPRWSSLDTITSHLFPDFDSWERRFAVATIVLFQRIYEVFDDMIASNMFRGTYKDILDEFMNYERWFANLAAEYRCRE